MFFHGKNKQEEVFKVPLFEKSKPHRHFTAPASRSRIPL